MATKENKEIIYPVRLTPELKSRLQKIADADHRKLAQYVRLVLEQAADNAERSNG